MSDSDFDYLNDGDEELDASSGAMSDEELNLMLRESSQSSSDKEIELRRQFKEEILRKKKLESALRDKEKKIPHRRGRKRQCYYNHTRKHILPGISATALNHYNTTDKPVASIVRWINGKLEANKMQPIEVVDFYFLLVERSSEGKIRDRQPRTDSRGEITIDEFNTFFLAWQSGSSSKDCAEAIGRESTTYTYHQIFSPLNKRDKQIRNSAASNSHLRTGVDPVTASANMKMIFGVAERRVIGGRMAFVLFADKLGDQLQQILYDTVPVLRVMMEHMDTEGQELAEEEAMHARPKDGVAPSKIKEGPLIKDEEPTAKDLRNTKKVDPAKSTIDRITHEKTAGHFRVGDMEQRPTFRG